MAHKAVVFIEQMIRIANKTEENIDQPNLSSRLFAIIHYILTECYFCRFLNNSANNSVQPDHGWPCARSYKDEEGRYYWKGRELLVTVLKDSIFHYLCINFPPTEASYFIIDISPTILPIFEATEQEAIEETAGDGQEAETFPSSNAAKALQFDVGLHITMIETLSRRIGHEILSKIGNSVYPRRNEFSMELLNFPIPKTLQPKKEKKRRTSQAASLESVTVCAKPIKAYEEIRKLVPHNSNDQSKLMGVILFIARENYFCKLETTSNEWPVKLDYCSEVTECQFKSRKYFFSLLETGSDFYLTVRNELYDLLAAKKIPKILSPTFIESDLTIDEMRIQSLSLWMNELFVSVIEKDINRAERSIRSSTSSLTQ